MLDDPILVRAGRVHGADPAGPGDEESGARTRRTGPSACWARWSSRTRATCAVPSRCRSATCCPTRSAPGWCRGSVARPPVSRCASSATATRTPTRCGTAASTSKLGQMRRHPPGDPHRAAVLRPDGRRGAGRPRARRQAGHAAALRRRRPRRVLAARAPHRADRRASSPSTGCAAGWPSAPRPRSASLQLIQHSDLVGITALAITRDDRRRVRAAHLRDPAGACRRWI